MRFKNHKKTDDLAQFHAFERKFMIKRSSFIQIRVRNFN